MSQELVIVIALALIFGFLNGMRDVSNIVATMISSRAFSPRTALNIAALSELIGPFLFGVVVAKTIADQVVDSQDLTPLYKAQPGKTLAQVIETLWLQAGPFMRVVFDNLMINVQLNHHHRAALTAIRQGDAQALREAIATDISEGMGLIASKGFANAA